METSKKLKVAIGSIATLIGAAASVVAIISFFRPADNLSQAVKYLVQIESHLVSIKNLSPDRAKFFPKEGNAPGENDSSGSIEAVPVQLKKVEGWIYLGKYDFNKMRWSVTTVDAIKIPAIGDTITLVGSVHFRDDKPSGLFYRKGNLKNPSALSAGLKVNVKKVAPKVGLGKYCWALVEVKLPY